MRNNLRKRMGASLLSAVTLFTPITFPPHQEVQAFPTATPSQYQISAQAGIVMDFDTGEILYAKNEKQMLDPASISKIMTNYIVFEEIEAGNLSYDTLITIGSYAASIYASVPLKAGDKVPLKNLIEIMLVPSSSGSCVAIAEHISGSESAFVQRMNETAKRLGIDAVYQQSHGSPNFPVNSVSVESQAILIRDFITRFPEVLNFTSLTRTTYKGSSYASTNKFYSSIPYSGIDGFKTGTTTNAGYCFSGTINKDGRRLISVVLKASSTDNRYYDTKNILEHSYSLLKTNSPVYDDIGTHPLRNNIEDFYMTGFSPYPLGANMNPDSPMWSDEFKSILINIANHYNLDTANIESAIAPQNLTKETALAMINEFVVIKKGAEINFADSESINPLYKQSIYNTASANIISGATDGASISPQSTFTKADALSTLLNVVNYIENNINWLPTTSNESVSDITTLETPINVNIPFDFTTYTTPSTLSSTVANHTSSDVELVAVKGGNWWNVNIDGVSQWLYTNNKLIYTSNNLAMYDNISDKNVLDIVTPQVLKVLGEENGYIQIESYLGSLWIDGDGISKTLKKDVFFTTSEDFILYNDTNLLDSTTHPSQSLQLIELTEDNIWKVKVVATGQIGYINTQGKLTYLPNSAKLYDLADDSVASVGTINGQVVQVEVVNGTFAQIPTWLGSKWVKLQ